MTTNGTSPETEFQQERMNEPFRPDPLYQEALFQWLAYYTLTETYDRMLPGAMITLNGRELWHVHPAYREASGHQAAIAAQHRDRRLAAAGVSDAISLDARDTALGLSYEKQLELMEQLKVHGRS